MQDERPLAFASRSFSHAERNYCQIEKELLAVVFSLRRFDQYVYARHVFVESDHQPLEILVRKPLKDVPRRLQRMLLELQRYDFTLTYKKGSLMIIADALSRAYLLSCKADFDAEERICQFSTQQDLEKVDLSQEVPGVDDERIKLVKEHTAADSLLQRLIELVQDGWQI